MVPLQWLNSFTVIYSLVYEMMTLTAHFSVVQCTTMHSIFYMQVALSLNNLAALLRKMCKVEQAEQLYKRSLSIREEALGPDHPQVRPHIMLLVLLHMPCSNCNVAAAAAVCASKLVGI